MNSNLETNNGIIFHTSQYPIYLNEIFSYFPSNMVVNMMNSYFETNNGREV